ncbi:MAG: hypothetical protein WC196_02740 [Bacilli bacterium]
MNKYGIKELEVGFHHYLYFITENGRRIGTKRIAKLYKHLDHYPFSDSGWAYYHLGELKRKQLQLYEAKL